MTQSKICRRQVILTWIGTALAWGVLSLAGVMLAAERTPVAVGTTTAVALATGALVDRRLRYMDRRRRITVEDLRAHRKRRRR